MHLRPKISMFCVLSQNNQQLFWKINYASYKKLFKELKNGIQILVGQAVFLNLKVTDQSSQNVVFESITQELFSLP